MRLPSKIFALAIVVNVAACGGGDSASGPLGKHFDEMYIVRIAPADKPMVGQTQNDWQLARSENATAEANLADTNTQISVAKNDLEAARLQVKSAESNKSSADKSADTTRVNTATKDLHTAQDVAKACEARVKYYEAYKSYLQKQQRYTIENMYWREAQFELAKAQVAQKNNIAPKDVSYDAFTKQEQERSKKAASAKEHVDSERQKAVSARDNWLHAQQTADQEAGRNQTYPDPLMQKSASASP
jgi:hypothetical protein